MLNNRILLAGLALGVASMVACSDDESTGAKRPAGACDLIATEDEGVEITCGNEVIGVIKETADGIYGASCSAKALKSADGYKIICGGDSVGVVYNGQDGRNGTPGSTGEPGASCSVEQADNADGYNIICGDKVVGELHNGEDGAPGSSGSKGDEGAPGSSGAKGDDGDDCSVTASGTDSEGNTTVTITCGTKDTKLTIAKGEDGAPGSSGAKGDPGSSGSQGEVGSSGAKGDDGDDCSVTATGTDAEGNTTVTITCGTKDTKLTIAKGADGTPGSSGSQGEVGSSGAAGKDGNSCETEQGVGYVDIICKDAEGTVTSSSKLIAAGYKACGDEVINTTTHFCYVDGETKTAYAKCNGNEYNPTIKECKCTTPGTMSTCSVVDKSVLCAAVGTYYDPATQICFDGNGNYDEWSTVPTAGVYDKSDYAVCYANDGLTSCGIYSTDSYTSGGTVYPYYVCTPDEDDNTKCIIEYNS